MIPDWRFIVAKHIIKCKFERGFMWDWRSFIDYSEDFNRDIILRKGDCFIDAGANTGMWTVPASRFYRKVIAIEPTLNTLGILKKNIRINRLDNVEVIPKALSDKVGEEKFYRWPDGALGNGLLREPVNYTSDYGEAVEDGTVKTITIDSLSNSSFCESLHPSVIKLDVEGAEGKAVWGGLDTIRKYYPMLIIEIHRKENEDKIRAILPEYQWTRRLRRMDIPGKTIFDQVHLLGTP